ncbi:hypothetical protein AAG906_007901 [Vitis piasezkii]
MQEMSKKIVRSLGVGRCLEWRTVNSRGASGVGIFLASCRFKNCEDDFCWIFTWVYGLTLKKEREEFWGELGAVRGLLGGPWCVAVILMWLGSLWSVVEEADLPARLVFGLGGLGRSFLGFVQCVLLKPVYDHCPILLDGGAAKLKVLKSLLRDWNRNVFGKVEVNKAWLDRLLAIHELEASEGAKEDFKKWILLEEISKRQKSREEGGDPVLVVCLFATLVAVEAARWRSLFREEVMGFFREFHYHNCFVKSECNFPYFDPKERGVEDLRDFRSISLVGGLYKWLAKVLANRNGLGGCGGVSPQPVFLLWLMGLPQGDPLSPYLFVIVMEALSCLLQRVVNGGFLLSYKVRGQEGEGAQVSHLLFADDTLVFCGASQDRMMYLSWTLMWFEVILGLRINLDKSVLIPVGCVENVEALAAELGCKVGSLLSSYLGLSLGALYKFVAAWDGVEVRPIHFQRRRITLIWSTLASLPISFMSVLFLPRTVKLRVKFWKDRWCGAAPFCVSFPTLFALAVSKDAWVSMGSVQQDVEDRVLWIETKCEKFSIKSLYKALGFDPSVSFPSNVIWKTCMQPKWVLPATVKETLLSWNGSFVGKMRKGSLESRSLMYFLDGLEGKK